MKILQYNVQSINANGNKELMELFLSKNNIEIACLVETWTKDNSKSKFKNFNFYCKGRSDGYGGVGIAIKKKYQILHSRAFV